jgi:Spy/CpxP family protein refolding chaperone
MNAKVFGRSTPGRKLMAAVSVAGSILATTVLAQSPQPAQTSPLPLGNSSRSLLLFKHSDVQKELRLTDSQKQRLKTLRDGFARENAEALKAADRTAAKAEDAEARRDVYYEFNTRMAIRAQEREPSVLKILTSAQRGRLDQIRLQSGGPLSFRLPEVQQRLNLDPGQIEQIGTILEDYLNEQRELRTAPLNSQSVEQALKAAGKSLGDRKARKAVVTEMYAKRESLGSERRKATDRKISRLLTKRQRAVYEKMLGEPFIVDGWFLVKDGVSQKPGTE